MSWWIRRKDKEGKQHLWAIDVDPIMVLIIFSLLMVFIIPNAHGASSLFMFAGFICLLFAKVSLFRRGVFISWGPSRMTRGYAILYRIGYILIIGGIVVRFLWAIGIFPNFVPINPHQ